MIMAWYEIVGLLLGAVGGISGIVGGFITMYNAKSNKDTIDISNFHSLIEEERTERKNLAQEYHEYKGIVERKVESVKKEFEDLRHENQRMLKSIYQAYRCKLPERMHDCPVIKAFNNDCVCEGCHSEETIEDMDKLSI